MDQQKIVETATGITGEADLGRATSSPFWKIYKVVTADGFTTTKFPIGPLGSPSSEKEFIWDDRGALNFSFVDELAAPTLSSVNIASNNSDTTRAKVGDEITLTIVASEYLQTPTITIAGHAATVAEAPDNKNWTGKYTLASGDTEGNITFSISFQDITGRAGTPVTATTDSSAVTFDKTAPTATLLYSTDGGANYYSTLSVKNADTLRIKATFSEALLDSPVVKLAIDNAVLAASDMTKTSTTVYYYDLNVPAGDVATATCSLSVGTDLAGNVVTAAPTNATFTIDNTLAVFAGVSVVSNNADTTRAKSGDTVTATFTTSEALVANPTVTIGTQAMTFVSLVSGTYTYSRVMDGSETEGTANVLATGTDIAGNVTTDTNVGSMITDFTLPALSSAAKDSVTQITVTLSELALASSITKANAGGFLVKDTVTPTTTYAVSAIAPGATNDLVVLTVADITASAANGVTITYAAGGDGTVADRASNLMATDATGVAIAPWA